MDMEKLVLIRTLSELQNLITYLQDKEYIAVDTETTGVAADSMIVGISVCADVEEAYYIILSYWDNDTKRLQHLETREQINSLLENLVSKHLIMHNGIFDSQMIYNNFRVQLINSLHTDTMILGHLLNENRHNGLKELGVSIFGQDANKEQREMKESVLANGGMLTKDKYELYKASPDLLGKYGAKDALLTLKLFYHFVEELYEQGLDKFFYEEESMPLLKGTTYELNTIGLKVDLEKLQGLRSSLEVECFEAEAFVNKEIGVHVKSKYPGAKPSNTFRITSGQQLAWLLYDVLGEDYHLLTDSGKEVCKALGSKLPYTKGARAEFATLLKDNKDKVWEEAKYNPKTKKMGRPKKIGNFWKYIATDEECLSKLANKHAFVRKILEHKKNTKLLNTYVIGMQDRINYGIIRPSFLQHGTTSGRYSSRNPNFQNLPRGDKRIKACIISRPGKVFVGADYEQLEPRVFSSISKDERLISSFDRGEDFYAVVGMPVFDITDCSLIKTDANSFAKKYSEKRDQAKIFGLATPYGRLAHFQAAEMGINKNEAQDLIDKYFEAYPKVELMMLESHEMAKSNGVVHSLYGRPRRMPQAKEITKIYGNSSHEDLPYEIRNTLNLAMNHRVQSTGASIMNRASIAFYNKIRELDIQECHIVMQVHDELIIECLEKDANDVSTILKYCMEMTTELPGVKLVTEPKISKDLANLK